jgi:Flp pilus assembly protein TadG
MRLPAQRPNRRGAALVEAAIVLPVFLTLALGMIDLGIAVFQNNAVAEASRQGARIASVHGLKAARLGNWGTTSYTGSGNASDTIPTAMRNGGALAGLKPANVTIAVSWPDGGNDPDVLTGNRVQVTMSTNWTPIISYVFGGRTVTLTATSTVLIAH